MSRQLATSHGRARNPNPNPGPKKNCLGFSTLLRDERVSGCFKVVGAQCTGSLSGEQANVVDLDAERRCLCGHPRREHTDCSECSESYPSVCLHQEASEDEGFYGVCPCWSFRTEPDELDDTLEPA